MNQLTTKIRGLREKYDPRLRPQALWTEFVHLFFQKLSTAYFRLSCAMAGFKLGRGIRVDGRVHLRAQRSQAIRFGEDVTINARPLSNVAGICQPTLFHTTGEGSIEIGSGSGLSGVVLSSRKGIRIGEHVNLGVNVRIYDHDFHSLDPIQRRDGATEQEYIKADEVVIEDDVFVGANAIILKGVHIGARSIIAAGSVVTRSKIPADSLVGGNPAQVIKSLAKGSNDPQEPTPAKEG